MSKVKIERVVNGILIMSILAILGSGCTKATPDPIGPGNVQSTTYVTLMNMAPYTPATEIYLNDMKSTSAVPPGTYQTSYSHLIAGLYDIKFKVAGSDSILAELPSSSYDSLSFYTLILYNTDTVQKTAKAVKILDDFSQISSNYTYWRFFDLCPGLPAIDVYLNGNLMQQNRTSADIAGTATQYTLFQSLPGNTYNMQVKKAGTDSVLATLGGINLLAGQPYTIFLSGTTSNAYFPVSLNIVQASY